MREVLQAWRYAGHSRDFAWTPFNDSDDSGVDRRLDYTHEDI